MIETVRFLSSEVPSARGFASEGLDQTAVGHEIILEAEVVKRKMSDFRTHPVVPFPLVLTSFPEKLSLLLL